MVVLCFVVYVCDEVIYWYIGKGDGVGVVVFEEVY